MRTGIPVYSAVLCREGHLVRRLQTQRVDLMPDLAAVLPALEWVDALTPEPLPALVVGLAALQARAAARLALQPAAPEPPAAEPPGLLRVPDVATRLHVPEQYVYELLRQGELTAIRFG